MGSIKRHEGRETLAVFYRKGFRLEKLLFYMHRYLLVTLGHRAKMDRSLARLSPLRRTMTNSSFMTDTLQVIYLPLDPSILSTLFAYLLRSIYFFNFNISLLLVIVEAELGLKNV